MKIRVFDTNTILVSTRCGFINTTRPITHKEMLLLDRVLIHDQDYIESVVVIDCNNPKIYGVIKDGILIGPATRITVWGIDLCVSEFLRMIEPIPYFGERDLPLHPEPTTKR